MQIYVNNDKTVGVLNVDTTINLNNTMTAADIQALIDAQPKNLGGYSLTFQFADGTYTLASTLTFEHFYGGILEILGNALDNTKSAIKAVKLYATSTDLILCHSNNLLTYVRYLDLRSADILGKSAFRVNASDMTAVQYCYIHSVSNVSAGPYGILSIASMFRDYFNLYGLSNIGLFGVQMSLMEIQSASSNGAGDQPVYGLYSSYGTTIAKSDGTLITASGAAETATTGGVIR